MSFNNNILNALVLMTLITYISSETGSNNRHEMIQGMEIKRFGIQYVINVLHQIDQSLSNLEDDMMMTSKRAMCSPIGGLPGADCELNEMGEEAKAQKMMRASVRNPGRKRRNVFAHLHKS